MEHLTSQHVNLAIFIKISDLVFILMKCDFFQSIKHVFMTDILKENQLYRRQSIIKVV